VSDVAVGTLSSAPVSRHRGFARGEQASDVIFRGVLYAAGILVLTLLGLIIILLFHGGLPVLYAFGIDFFTSSAWNPVTEKYGAVVAVYGTIITAVIAVVVAVPAAFGISFFLTEVAPPVLRRSIGTAIQLLAAIPSIIFGMWGFFVVVPLMATYVQPALASTLGVVPVIGTLFSGAPIGTGILTAGLIMALMILPFITALFVEVLESVPPMFKEAAYGVGATTSEVFTAVSIPYGRTASSAPSCWGSDGLWAKPWLSPSSSATPTVFRHPCFRQAPRLPRRLPTNSRKLRPALSSFLPCSNWASCFLCCHSSSLPLLASLSEAGWRPERCRNVFPSGLPVMRPSGSLPR